MCDATADNLELLDALMEASETGDTSALNVFNDYYTDKEFPSEILNTNVEGKVNPSDFHSRLCLSF